MNDEFLFVMWLLAGMLAWFVIIARVVLWVIG